MSTEQKNNMQRNKGGTQTLETSAKPALAAHHTASRIQTTINPFPSYGLVQ